MQRVADLKRSGAITAEEFAQKCKELVEKYTGHSS